MYCPNCGTENEDTRQFCRRCGHYLRWEVTDRRVSDTGFRLVLEVWRVWAPRIDDAEGQLHFHNGRARLLGSLVDKVGLHVTDWGDTHHEVPSEKVWVRAEAPSEAAVGEVIRQTSAWVRSGELKNAFITVGDGAMTPVIGLDPETWLRDSSPDTTAAAGGGAGYRGGNAPPDYEGREATRMAQPQAAAEQAERERGAERQEAERAAIEYQRRTVERDAQRQQAQRPRPADEAYPDRPPAASPPPSRGKGGSFLEKARQAAKQAAERVRPHKGGRRPEPAPRAPSNGGAGSPIERALEAAQRGARTASPSRSRPREEPAGTPVAGNSGQGAPRTGGGEDHPEPVAANGGRGPTGNGGHGDGQGDAGVIEEPVAGNGGRGVPRNGGGQDHPEPVAANGGGRGPARNGGGGHETGGGPPPPNGGRRGQRAKPPERGAPGPAHKAYGLLIAPAEVVAMVEFELDVGLSKDPAPGVAGPPMIDLPPLAAEPYVVNVRIAAAGFAFPRGQKRRLELKVHKGDPYPKETVRLIPKTPIGDAAVIDRPITAEYSIDGERLGDAIRSVRVLKAEAQRTRPEEDRVETGVNVPAPTGEETADLTITIRYSDRPPIMEWTVDSPHTDVVTPTAKPFEKPLPNADDFLRNAILQIDGAEGKEGVFSDVLALGSRVAQSIPPDIWKAIRAVATKRGEPPTILLLSEEPFVPWELAKVDPPLVAGADLPPFLSAQARIGRWVQATEVGADGRPRPSPIPPARKDVASWAVVSGKYTGKNGWQQLTHARQEASDLKRLYGAVQVKALNKDMYELLRGIPPADLLHFAVHGRYNPQDAGKESGIILADGNSLHANEIAARDLATKPVVFLNACQVGAGLLELGAYSGVAAAFVEAGASAVVAPLWKVDDGIAKEIALAFYVAAAKGEPLSEVLRKAREPFVDKFETKSATFMAYQLFGHPEFVIGGLQSK